MALERLDAVAVFARVVEAGSFSSAARSLGLGPSAVSKSVAALEEHLGARLLNRTTRRLSLTEVGVAYYERARVALAALEEAQTAVTDLSAAPRGVLRVTMPVAYGSHVIAPLLPGFMDRHPEVRLEVIHSDLVVDLVNEGIDVAIRIAELRDSTLVARLLSPNRRVVCASPDYLARAGVPERPADLARFSLLAYALPTGPADWMFQAEGRRIVQRVVGRLQTNNFILLREAAMAGQGLIRLSEYLVGDALRDGRLVPVLTDFEMADTGIYAVYPARRHLTPKVRAFVDYLAETIGKRR